MAKSVNYLITAPVKKSCDGYGLHFVDGVATTEQKALAEYLATLGYEVKKSGAERTGRSANSTAAADDEDDPAGDVDSATDEHEVAGKED